MTFLEGILDPSEYVYMHCPDGMHLSFDLCLEVRKGLYGMVQSDRVFYTLFYDHITSEECGFQQSEADQCFFYKIGKRGLIKLLLYVNDLAIIGSKEDIDETIKLIQLRFTIRSEGRLNDFLGCDKK